MARWVSSGPLDGPALGLGRSAGGAEFPSFPISRCPVEALSLDLWLISFHSLVLLSDKGLFLL